MRPLAVHESENSLALETDAFLKPNKSFNDDQGKLSLFVRFLECPQYREIRPRGELTQEEFDVTWYSENEYHYMKTVNIVTVRMMLFGHSLDPEIYCPRGLVSIYLLCNILHQRWFTNHSPIIGMSNRRRMAAATKK